MLITASAKAKIKEFLDGTTDKVFRISVSTGGCSGFKYLTEITDSRDDDIIIYDSSVTDPASNQILDKVIVDYASSISQSGFIFSNPDASSTCGCGMSFDNEN